MNKSKVFMAFAALAMAMPSMAQRQETAWNNDWRFIHEDVAEAKETKFNDKSWRTLNLPHDWSIENDFKIDADMGNESAYLPAGAGWYRKTLNAPKAWEGKRVVLLFDGVYQDSKVFVNGQEAGGHYYGYTPFVIDITDQVKTGQNTVAVRVDNSAQKNSRWYSGSGIYRPVHLIVCDQLHITPWGVAITTPEVAKDKATVRVATEVKNEGKAPRTFRVKTTIGAVKTESSTVTLQPGCSETVTQEIALAQPKLWSIDTPNLYEAKVEIIENGKAIDSKSEAFGVRTIEYDAQQGLRINGVPTLINGGDAHHDNGILGAAAFKDAEYRRVRLMKDAGFNLVRTSHNPPSADFLRACDELGLMVIDEAFDGWVDQKNSNDYHLRFKQESSADVAAMTLRDRNHPSIISWSIGNEIIERKHISSIATAQRLKKAILQHDSTRPVTEALCAWDPDWEIYDPHAAVLDITGFNYMMHKAESDHERIPERVMWQTESYPRDAFSNWEKVNDLPYVIGDVVWTAIDYLGESGIGRFFYEGETDGEPWMKKQFPWHGAYCGDIDITGWRKPISHYREMLYFPERNKLYLAVKEPDGYYGKVKETMWSVWPTWESWNWNGHEGKDITVDVYSRHPKVRLYLNDQLVAERTTSRKEQFKAEISIPYAPGTLKAVGVDENGKEVESRTLQTAGAPAAIRLTADRSTMSANGQDLAFVIAELVDANGIPVPNADAELTFEVKGSATLAGSGSANLQDTVAHTTPCHKTYKGRAMAVVRSALKGGRATLTVSAKGIKTQSISIAVQ